MMIGDHTNVYGHATYLNRVARRFGFSYRYDCLLGIDKPSGRPLRPAAGAASDRPGPPPEMDFATSNSVDPGMSGGRARCVRPG